jgi:lysophospholipase L1-like esterase
MGLVTSVDDQQASSSRRRPPARLWLFRSLAILCGLSIFVVVEAACCLLGVGEPQLDDDPFVGFSSQQPLFEKDANGDLFVTSKSRLKFFSFEEFSATKPAGTKRIFCLGGSTVKGRPFSKETSFTTWLQLALQEAQPDRNWEVINCGGISYASYRLVPILQECLAYQPDAFIICTGHNEFLEDRSYGEMRDVSPIVTGSFYGLSKLRSFRLIRQTMLSDAESEAGDRDQLGADVDAFLDYKNGLAAYHRDDDWRRGVAAHFESNLERMVSLARRADVPIILIRPPSNLADSPPFKSEHRSDITPRELADWEAAIDAANSTLKTFPAAAVDSFREAISIDTAYADTHFESGRLLELAGDFAAARDEFLLAREHDICPLRIITPLELALSRVADRNRVPLLNAHQLLEAETRNGILDGSMLVDHVHPSFEGHQLIAMALVEELERVALLAPQRGWRTQSNAAFKRHFEQLPDIYFALGEQNLANLRFWTQGMADGPPVASRRRQKAMSSRDSR